MTTLALAVALAMQKVTPIDRRALVARHNVVLTAFNGERPLQVGNGEFAFGMDATGLQSFAPFNTMSQWGWHHSPPPAGHKPEEFEGQVVETHGRPVRYPMFDPNHPQLSSWRAASPHRIDLGRVGLELTKRDGTVAEIEDLRNPRQTLDLWTGVVTSRFVLEGVPVQVVTACHPTLDAVAVRIESPLVRAVRLVAFLDVPGNNPLQFANFVGDWSHPATLERVSSVRGRADFVRRLDDDSYRIGLAWQGEASLHQPAAMPAAPIHVLKAEYGAPGKWLDVTDVVRGKVRDGSLSMRVNNDLGPDPAPGVPKSIRVVYAVAGKTKRASAAENEELRIDASSGQHGLVLRPGGSSDTLSFTCAFAPRPLPKSLPTADAVLAASRKGWPAYWKSGGAIDLSGSKDRRWRELERRIVLSQYLMKVNEAGSLPPQESGLVNNGWYGKFHLEMVWWHAAHWALWDRWPEVDRSLDLYRRLLPKAQRQAADQGYRGTRWPKCIGPDMVEWPHEIHAFLIWQQPHPIFFAELDYRAHPTPATLEKWRPIVEATADFLASYAFFDEKTKRYVLGPPLHVVSENTDPKITQNPTFELGYWRFGLRTAQTWRKRLGLAPNPQWQRVADGLSPLPQEGGRYVLYEGVKDMWTEMNFEHPALTGAFGMLPGDGVDRPTMRRTLDKVAQVWNFERTWGWDFPMLAMCAARLGEPERAVDFLLHPSSGFQFDERGLATGGPFPYFPSNGGLLYAVALMAKGWDGGPKTSAPGFPKGWNVRSEGLRAAP